MANLAVTYFVGAFSVEPFAYGLKNSLNAVFSFAWPQLVSVSSSLIASAFVLLWNCQFLPADWAVFVLVRQLGRQHRLFLLN